MSNDFSNKEIPHYPGYLVGIRAMVVHRTGKIHSPSQYFVWAPGPNRAGCSVSDRFYYDPYKDAYYSRDRKLERHVARRSCSCGFYAYFSRENASAYLPDYNGVYAVVKAYGRVTYGDLGFRAEKMEILALVDPTKRGANDYTITYGSTSGPPKRPSNWPVIGIVLGLILVFSTSIFLFASDGYNWPWFVGLGLYVVGAFMALGFSVLHRRRTEKFYDDFRAYVSAKHLRTSPRLRRPGTNQAAYFERCKQLYPDIPWYDTVEAAIKDFPLSGKVH